MAKETTVHIRMPDRMSARAAATFVRSALRAEWLLWEHDKPMPRWNVTVYQTFDIGGPVTEHRKVRT